MAETETATESVETAVTTTTEAASPGARAEAMAGETSASSSTPVGGGPALTRSQSATVSVLQAGPGAAVGTAVTQQMEEGGMGETAPTAGGGQMLVRLQAVACHAGFLEWWRAAAAAAVAAA